MLQNQAGIFRTFIFIYILAIGFETLSSSVVLGQRIYLPEFVFLLLGAFLVIGGHIAGVIRENSKKNRIQLALLLYSGAVCISWLVHPGSNSFAEWLGTVYMLGVFWVLRWYFQDYPDEKEKLGILFRWAGIICAASILTGYVLERMGVATGLFTYYEKYPLLGDSERAIGFTRHPIFLSSFLLTCIWMTLPELSHKKRTSPQSLLVVLMMLAGVVLTLSKSILPFVTASLWYHHKRSGRIVWLIGSAVVLFIWLFLTHFSVVKKDDVADAFKAQYSAGYAIDFNASYSLIPTKYLLLKETAWKAWLEHPVSGIGGNELIHYNERLYQQGALPVTLANSPHSTLSGALGELGIVGFASILFLFYALWKSSSQYEPIGKRYYLQAFIIFFAVESISGDLMNLRHLWIVFAWIAAEAASRPSPVGGLAKSP